MPKILLLAFALALVGCGGSVADKTDGGSKPNGDGSTSGGSPIDGMWTGYIESYMFPSMSDALALTLKASNGTVTGTITFGKGGPYPPPTNPDIGYPPNWKPMGMPMLQQFVGDGFPYTIVNGTFDGSRVRISANTMELWKAWCEIQTKTYDWGGGMYSCLPNWGFSWSMTMGCSQQNPMTMQDVPVDCAKLALCDAPVACKCTATGCTVPLGMGDVTLDMVFAGSALDGSSSGKFGAHNVHLKKN